MDEKSEVSKTPEITYNQNAEPIEDQQKAFS